MATQTALRPGEIKDILLREIEAAELNSLDVEEVGSVLEVKDGIARIYGLGKVMAGQLLPALTAEDLPDLSHFDPSTAALALRYRSLRGR